VVTILLARVLLKERLRLIQKIGAVLSLVGAAVIAA
jgi:drug/metabolite transporter (DMT)-like permease